jgi:hypothetical protein
MFHRRSKNASSTIRYSKTAEHVAINQESTEIGTATFADYQFLKSVTFPKTSSTSSSSSSSSITTVVPITKIGRYAFRCCSSLKFISIPSTVTEIDYGAFMGCTSLTSIEIPMSVKIIHRFAFSHCSSLVTVTFSSSNDSLQICAAAFNNCKSLISIAIPQNATFVTPPDGYDARNPPPFGCCTKLERIHIKHSRKIDMNTWLQSRFDNLLLHEICYDPNVTLQRLKSFIQSKAGNIHNNIYNNSNSNSNSTDNNMGEITDLLDMTALHVLSCNPNVTPKLIETVVKAFPKSTTMEATNNMTPLQLYLRSNGLSSFDPKQVRVPLNLALEKGMDWHIIENILAFQQASLEQGVQDETTGFYPFMKAATLSQCNLNVLLNLALYNMEELCSHLS